MLIMMSRANIGEDIDPTCIIYEDDGESTDVNPGAGGRVTPTFMKMIVI